MLAPIVIFAFNRPEALCKMLSSLRANPLYEASEKYFYIDGCRNDSDKPKVEAVVEIARKESRNVKVAEKNKGLARNVIDGVTEVINKHGKAIVIEDDLYCAPRFLEFMNQALDQYEKDDRIISVCGYGLKIKRPRDYHGDVYLSPRSSSWGWGTWVDRWNAVDWEVKDWTEIKDNRKIQTAFNRGGSDMFGMLRDYMEGRNNSWAIRFCYSQFKRGLYSVHPFKSLVENDGFGAAATNCKQKYSRFRTEMNTSQDISDAFVFSKSIAPNSSIFSQLASYHSIRKRMYSRLRRLLNI